MNRNLEYKKRFYDMENEESWLNEMSEKGLALKEIKWRVFKDIYRFEPCDKRYVYREDYNMEGALEELTSPYIKFVTETYGCEFVCLANGKVYFRKAAENGDFPPVYTDLNSRIEAEKKFFWKTVSCSFCAFPIMCICGLNIYNTFDSDTVFGRMGFVFSIIALFCAVIDVVWFIPAALQKRKKIKELEKILDEKGGE
ncbi:MAG: DUF2812 domain-containing protein [Oscillospiraceae bacterium]|nr:DUF2812 domain-containing protein [Oscillospiraceae bacterium]